MIASPLALALLPTTVTDSPCSVTVACPDCGRPASALTLEGPCGLVLSDALPRSTLLDHADCDLVALCRALSLAAHGLSRPQVFHVTGQEG
jgi:hypothetical protein